MRSPKLFGAIAFVFFLSAIGAHAAPYFTYNPTLLPQLNASFDLGTSTDPWRAGYFGTLCIAGDCRTAWPGGGGGSGNVATSSQETAGYFPVWTSTNGTPALLAGISQLFQSGTNVGVGTSTPRQKLDVNGNVIFNDLAPFQAVTSPMAKAQNEEVITAFQSGNGFTYNSGNGSSAQDTTDYVVGNQSLKVVTDAAGTQSRVQNLSIPAFSVVNKTILATVKVDKSFTTTDNLFIGFSSDNFTNFFYCSFTYDAFQHYYGGDWFNVSCSPSDYNTTGSPNLNAITAIRLYVRGASGTTHTAWFNKVSLVPNNVSKKGVVSITFDDGSDGQYNYGLPVLATSTYNLPATAYIETDNIGNGSYMTKDQLSTMQNIDGWEIAAHYQTSFAAMTYDQQENAIVTTKNWLIKNGFAKGADDFAYPQGEAVSTTTLPLVQKYFTTARMSSDGRHETFPIGNPYALKVFPVKNTTSTSSVYAAIDAAAANHDWLILVFHKILPSGAAISTEYNQRDLQYIADYLHSKQDTIDVKTVNDVINRNDDSIVHLVNNNLGIGTTSPYAPLSLGGGNLVLGAAFAGGTPGDLFLPKLGTAAGSFIAIDATGKVIATSTPVERDDNRKTTWGILSEDFPVGGVPNTSILVSGSVYYSLIGLHTGDVVHDICIAVATASGSSTHTYVALYNSAGSQVAISSDQTTTYDGTTGPVCVPLNANYTVPSEGGYYAAFLSVATTPPTVARGGSAGAFYAGINGGVRLFGVQTGQTTPPSSATLSASSNLATWMAVY